MAYACRSANLNESNPRLDLQDSLDLTPRATASSYASSVLSRDGRFRPGACGPYGAATVQHSPELGASVPRPPAALA